MTGNFQVVILVDQFDAMISSEENGHFRSRDVRFYKKGNLQNNLLMGRRIEMSKVKECNALMERV